MFGRGTTRPLGRLVILGCLLVLLGVPGCRSDPERDRLMKEEYPAYPALVKQAVDEGYVLYGMTQAQVYLALGPPYCKAQDRYQGKAVEAWMYPPNEGFACTRAANKVFFENGAVIGWKFINTR